MQKPFNGRHDSYVCSTAVLPGMVGTCTPRELLRGQSPTVPASQRERLRWLNGERNRCSHACSHMCPSRQIHHRCPLKNSERTHQTPPRSSNQPSRKTLMLSSDTTTYGKKENGYMFGIFGLEAVQGENAQQNQQQQ